MLLSVKCCEDKEAAAARLFRDLSTLPRDFPFLLPFKHSINYNIIN